MSRHSSASKLVSAASASCGWLLQSTLASASAAAAPSAVLTSGGVRGLATKLAVVPREEPQTALNSAGLSPAWIPPPNNPQSLYPKAQRSPQEVLASIRQAASPLEVHNAFRRRPSRLPPAVAAAKFARLSELLRSDPACLASPASSSVASAKLRDPSHLAAQVPGLGQLVREIGGSWDAFLQLYGADHLATCVRAAAETGLVLSSRELGPAAAAAAPEAATASSSSGHASSSGSSSSSGAAAAGAGATSAGSRSGAEGRGLLQRSLDVLLDRGGLELASAGPQAVVDLSYGLMLVGHVRPETWRVLGPLLHKAAAAAAAGGQQAAAAGVKERATEVVVWLQAAGVKA